MKILFIGGTGLISSACADLAAERGHEVFLLNRSHSTKYPAPKGVTVLQADLRDEKADLSGLLSGEHFDAVVDFIAYTPHELERDLQLTADRTDQFVFISSASAYQKPPQHYLITEETPLENPFWEYSRDKIACESLLMKAHRGQGLPVTIIRPSLTYGPSQIPLCVGNWQQPWTNIDWIKQGRKVIIPGDGTSLWVVTWNADFAVGLLGLLGNPAALGEAFHITSDEVLTWDQIAQELFHALGMEPRILHIPSDFIARIWPHAVGSLIGDKSNSVVFDNSKIKRFVPEFNCKVRWAEGVRRALAWYEADVTRQTVDQESQRLWDKITTAYEAGFPGP
jgi:nucleoside-diphosphate-sugar epimerase